MQPAISYAREPTDRIYKVMKVQEFTKSKSCGIKIKNGRCYQAPRQRCVYLAHPFISLLSLFATLLRYYSTRCARLANRYFVPISSVIPTSLDSSVLHRGIAIFVCADFYHVSLFHATRAISRHSFYRLSATHVSAL